MKKIHALSLIGVTFGIVSLSAFANPPTANGIWKGTYTVLRGPSCTAGDTGTATLTQTNVNAMTSGDTNFKSTLTLEGLKVNSDDSSSLVPPFATGVSGQSVISLQGGGAVYINQGDGNPCATFGSSMFAYDDDAQKITVVPNSSDGPTCPCWVQLSNLTFTPSANAKK